ncbi:MAG: solute-binding protein [Chloroflexi bacterium]|nr:solute-binding protein [Chloroflexota bacterium]
MHRSLWIRFLGLLIVMLGVGLVGAGCQAGSNSPARSEIILATTTSTYDSGLLDEIIPVFEQRTGYQVKIVAVGTGKALRMGQEGNADVLLTHAPEAERPLVEHRDVVDYRLVMYNDFVLVGPKDDPAGVRDATSVADAFRRIAEAGALFVSRGDDSGTHKKERSIWKKAGLDSQGQPWYLESGQGMGATLRIASEKGAYTLTDRGTYLSLRDTLNLDILYEGDPDLLNIYHIMMVNPEKWPQVNVEGAKALIEFFVSPETQAMIGEFGVEKYGQPLFFPAAHMTEEELKSGGS